MSEEKRPDGEPAPRFSFHFFVPLDYQKRMMSRPVRVCIGTGPLRFEDETAVDDIDREFYMDTIGG